MKPTLGVCYYPEQWSQSMWQADAELMVRSGISWVRIGEFAWSRIEPEPGLFDWQWLDEAISTLAQAGLKIVLGVPTATPPRWMLNKYPDMLAVDANGQVRQFGSRRHYDFSHRGYREEAVRISRKLAQRYAGYPAIQFWQVDNEYGCHQTTLSFSITALCEFRYWLEQRYADILALNEAWGNVFWSMEYGGFDEIELPNLTVTEANPAHWHDFRRYASEQVRIFNKALVEAIREYDSDTPVLHNYMGRVTDFDHFALGEDLDAASWDSYPLGFLEDRSEASDDTRRAFMRQGDPDFQAFHHDLYRAVGRGRWWVMEQQPGPVNWAPYNPVPLPGMVRLWSWEAIAHGAEVVSYFRWRQSPSAQEQMHAGLLRADNQPAPGLLEVQRLARELADQTSITEVASIAIVFDYESAWAWETQPQGADFSYFKLLFEQYRALRELGMSVDFCSPDTKDFTPYKLILIPGMMHWKGRLKEVLSAYDDVLLLGPRTGSKTEHFSIPKNLAPNCPELIDLKVTQVESLPAGARVALNGGGYLHRWREYLEAGDGVESLLVTDTDEPVLVQKNNVHYLAGIPDRSTYQVTMELLCQKAGLPTVRLPQGLRIREWGDSYVAMNYSSETVSLSDLDGIASFQQDSLEAAGVAIGKRLFSNL